MKKAAENGHSSPEMRHSSPEKRRSSVLGCPKTLQGEESSSCPRSGTQKVLRGRKPLRFQPNPP